MMPRPPAPRWRKDVDPRPKLPKVAGFLDQAETDVTSTPMRRALDQF